jgi:hypothetical protein
MRKYQKAKKQSFSGLLLAWPNFAAPVSCSPASGEEGHKAMEQARDAGF